MARWSSGSDVGFGFDTGWLFLSRVISTINESLANKLSWDITTSQVDSALHPSSVAKLSTSFGWGKDGKVTAAGWQVTLCYPTWHVIFHSGVVISINKQINKRLTVLTKLRLGTVGQSGEQNRTDS